MVQAALRRNAKIEASLAPKRVCVVLVKPVGVWGGQRFPLLSSPLAVVFHRGDAFACY